ncbi:hypothetical protein [Mycoplasma sp. 'Moose RK']|uniref:hypothetical protein n=1 Tax=Mycoplasma sp. 'Moose RK' TaxID=2780095 RepID=UPI0018C2F341|nr:hypothetical protein [Mycoplasma sp. 'Moose RK']MBG0730674.1 hypothetical protein [Mycoplasma sp. 'Moose RK']
MKGIGKDFKIIITHQKKILINLFFINFELESAVKKAKTEPKNVPIIVYLIVVHKSLMLNSRIELL